ncbi:Ca-activated chloride channel family protein [Lachnospiraceae bacterium XPB1003]|nr:Ca-activated chloride channel family protein [Lachnospiraceae bacterium XPB1003]
MKKRMLAIMICLTVATGMLAGCAGKPNIPENGGSISGNVIDEGDKDRDLSAWDDEEDVPSESKMNKFMSKNNGGSFNLLGGTKSARGYTQTCEAACAAEECDASYTTGMTCSPEIPFNTEEYNYVKENGFLNTSITPLSTFAADVDTGSYANFRRMVNDGYGLNDIPSGAVRTEEMLNYFDYTIDDANVSSGAFSVQYETGTCPWNKDNTLLMMTVQANQVESSYKGNNYVFLIDTSGSMASQDKIDLAVIAFKKLANTLTDADSVSIVTYSGSSTTLLKGAEGTDQDAIDDALDEAYMHCYCYGGGTNGSGGIEAAYKLAEDNFIEGGNNRVIIASDGDMNLGITDNSGLVDLITKKKETGIFLTTLGFGSGNYSDANMEAIADAGNGNYFYIDCMDEAKRVLCDKMSQTFVTVAKDVKFQVEFNPAAVSEYRLIGYENRTMAAEDFADDTKDGGEVGAGAQVTVLYELVPAGEGTDIDLKYQEDRTLTDAAASDEVGTVSIRYKAPDGDTSTEEEYAVRLTTGSASDDFNFASAVAEASMVITGSDHMGDSDIKNAAERAKDSAAGDEAREQFAELIGKF